MCSIGCPFIALHCFFKGHGKDACTRLGLPLASLGYPRKSVLWFLSALNTLAAIRTVIILECESLHGERNEVAVCVSLSLFVDGGGASPVSVRLGAGPGCQLSAGDPRPLRLLRHP